MFHGFEFRNTYIQQVFSGVSVSGPYRRQAVVNQNIPCRHECVTSEMAIFIGLTVIQVPLQHPNLYLPNFIELG